MKLLDLLSVIDENTAVFVWAYDKDDPDKVILISSGYDNDSIDPAYNDEVVESVSGAADGSIDIVLTLEVGEDAMIDV